MTETPTFFREYDIRGIYEKDLTTDVAYRLGRSVGTFFGIGKKVNVARDTRRGSVELSEELNRGLIDSGCSVNWMGEVPSPLLYYSVVQTQSDFGVMVTASHLPPQWNGFKFCDSTGQIISRLDGLEKIQSIYVSSEYGKINKGNLSEYTNLVNDYKLILKKYTDSAKKGFKVTFDLSNSVPSLVIPEIFQNSGIDAVYINREILDTPSHDVEPNAFSMLNLKEEVLRNGSDIGIMYDADGDRMAIVDENGQIYSDGTVTIALFALMYSHNSTYGPVVMDVSCPSLLGDFLKGLGLEPKISKVGHGYCSNLAKQNQALYAAQFSGHIALREANYRDDAIFASVRLIDFVSNSTLKLSELIHNSVPTLSYIVKNIEVPDYLKFNIIEQIRNYLVKEEITFTSLDGIKVLEDNGGFLVRASNTSNLIRIMAEGKNKQIADLMLEKCLFMINEVISID